MSTPAQTQLARAVQAFRSGDVRGTLRLTGPLVRDNPGLAQAWELHAAAQVAAANFDGAISSLGRVLALAGDVPEVRVRALAQLARVELTLGREADAVSRLDEVLGVDPGNAVAIGMKAEALAHLDRAGEAAGLIADARARGIDDLGIVLAEARLAMHSGDAGPVIERLRARVDDPGLSAPRLSLALSRLGDLLDRAGDYDEAFAAYRRSASLSAQPYDPGVITGVVDRLIAGWTPASVGNVKGRGDGSEQPVFIVGLPRSGTSLVEQILDCHPQVSGAGELGDLGQAIAGQLRGQSLPEFRYLERPSGLRQKMLAEAASGYLGALRAAAGDRGAARLTDKQPLNLFGLGPAGLMLPGSRVIWCRRDPRDTCLSCYFKRLPSTHRYQHSLEHLGRLSVDADRLMEHWKEVLGRLGVAVCEVWYERLVAEQEAESRRLVAFLGLDWSDRCLRFYESERLVRTLSNEQVRRPMYSSSVGRYRNYHGHLRSLDGVLVSGPDLEAPGGRDDDTPA